MKALRRSELMVSLGKLFYTGRRYLEWYSGGVRFDMGREESWLPLVNFSHRTPLLRRLQDVDMWLQYNKVSKYEVYEKEHRITHEPWIGYLRHNEIWRRVYNRERELVRDEYVTENHALMMYPPFLPAGETGEKVEG